MEVRQEIALSLKCHIPVPGFRVAGTLADAMQDELIQDPNHEIVEDIFIGASDNKVTQIYYFDGQNLTYPLLSIDDPYICTGRQGLRLDNNLVTKFPGELKLDKKTIPELENYLRDTGHKGYIALTFSLINGILYYNRIALTLPDDYAQNMLNLYQTDKDTFLEMLFDKDLPQAEGISCSCRLYSYPYNQENNTKALHITPVPGAYPLQYCYAISHYQEYFHIKDAWKALYQQLSDRTYTHNRICFNLDGGYRARKVFDILKRNHLIK